MPSRENGARAEAMAEIRSRQDRVFSNVSHESPHAATILMGPLGRPADRFHESPRTANRRVGHRPPEMRLRILNWSNSLGVLSEVEAGRASLVMNDGQDDLTSERPVFPLAVKTHGLSIRVDCEHLPGPVYVDREMWEKDPSSTSSRMR